jgi:hypothetical protein
MARQPSLFPKGRPPKGPIERYAEQDLRILRQLETIPPGMKAIEAAYRKVAALADSALAEGPDADWKMLNAARELRHQRELLCILKPESTGDERDQLLALLSATPGNPPQRP